MPLRLRRMGRRRSQHNKMDYMCGPNQFGIGVCVAESDKSALVGGGVQTLIRRIRVVSVC